MTPMHPDELEIGEALVRGLLTTQMPEWERLPLAPVPSAGTDHALYRLGAALLVRLPRTPAAAMQVEKERRWLSRLAPHLPLAIPELVASGRPAGAYPLTWSVYRWIPGAPPAPGQLSESTEAAASLGGFAGALRAVDATSAPAPGAHNFHRGVPLADRDGATREALSRLVLDERRAVAVWDAALRAPAWDGPPAWLHGDLLPANLLVRDGQLAAVIDFGGLAAGDPACDLLPAWAVFGPGARATFLASAGLDDAAWARGRGWALSVGAIALPYYAETNPAFAAVARRMIEQALEDGPL